MKMNEIEFEGGRPVDGYGPGGFRVGGVFLTGAQLLTPSGAEAWDGSDLAPLLALEGRVDVILMGMGAEIALAPLEARAALEAMGIGVDAMSSPSACRTYNVLLAEGRRVAAALLPV